MSRLVDKPRTQRGTGGCYKVGVPDDHLTSPNEGHFKRLERPRHQEWQQLVGCHRLLHGYLDFFGFSTTASVTRSGLNQIATSGLVGTRTNFLVGDTARPYGLSITSFRPLSRIRAKGRNGSAIRKARIF